MESYEGVDNKAWAPCKPGWLEAGEGVELDTGEVRASPPGDGGGDGED